jgi:hypothetical protein
VACGSGHILLAAARRLATELAIVRTREEQPSPTALRSAVRDVIRHCLYGMDLNPLAVELCKVALWLEAHGPGQALSFLDHRIHCGNAIVGLAHRDELKRGIPDEAFKTLPGDDRELAAALRRQNRDERQGQQALNFAGRVEADIRALDEDYRAFEQVPERGAVTDYQARRQRYEQFRRNPRLRDLSLLADAQVAQFYLPKTPENRGKHVTHDAFSRWMEGVNPIGPGIAAAMTIAERKRFGHWFIEFWDVVDAGGFDLIIGNPPYLGGTKLSGSYGHAFCEWVKWEFAPAGLSDLVVFFLRRIYDLLRPGGFVALITTNSIKDGDIRADGLEQIISQGGNLTFAISGTRWPGIANLYVSLFSLHRGLWDGRVRVLDGKEVPFISSFFEGYADAGAPKRLRENEDRLFEGSKFLGDGFLLTHEEAARMTERSVRLKEVLFPVINGEELNNNPTQEPGRSIINFFDWPVEKAELFGEAFARVRELVKPVRDQDNRAIRRERWWQYAERAVGLYSSVQGLQRCFAASATTKHLSFVGLPSDLVYTQALKVFTSDRWSDFAVVQSTLHEVWARKYSGSLETRLRYSPTDCFATFPFPRDPASESALAAIGEAYHEHRRELMRDLWLGLTDLYNLFHRPDLAPEHITKVATESRIPADEGFSRLQRLRALHVQLDQTVLAAYGWDRPGDFGPALELRHDFYPLDFLPENDRTRLTLHPEARREVLARLLKLNHQRAAQAEEATPATAIGKQGKRTKSKQPALQFPATDLPLFQVLPAATTKPVEPPTLQEVVAAFDFALPSRRRPVIHSTAELYVTLIPALVQAAGGRLDYAELLEAMTFLAAPPTSGASLPQGAASVFGVWRASFPSSLVDPRAFQAALHDLIVMRHALNIRVEENGFTIFKGIQWADISFDWTLLDARMALSHAATAGTASEVWLEAVPGNDLKLWSAA